MSSGSFEYSMKAAPSALSKYAAISASFKPEFIAQSTLRFSSRPLFEASFCNVLNAAARVFMTT